MDIFSMHTPWNSFLREPWVANFYTIMVICKNLAGLRNITTSNINTTIETRWSTMVTLMMRGRRSGQRPKSTSPKSINTFYKHWTSKSGWSLQSYFHVLHCHPYYLLIGRYSVWYRTYNQISHNHQEYLDKKALSLPFSPWLWEE